MDFIFQLDAKDDFETAVEYIIKNLYEKQDHTILTISESIATKAREEIRELIIKTSCDKKHILDYLIFKGYDKDRTELFHSLIDKRHDKLLYLTLINYNSSYGETVEKFDWALKLIHGTSELKKLKYLLVQLVLTTVDNSEKNQRIYEITKDVLLKIITTLENIDI